MRRILALAVLLVAFHLLKGRPRICQILGITFDTAADTKGLPPVTSPSQRAGVGPGPGPGTHITDGL